MHCEEAPFVITPSFLINNIDDLSLIHAIHAEYVKFEGAVEL